MTTKQSEWQAEMMMDRTEDGEVRILVPAHSIHTKQAEDIIGRIGPEFFLMFLEKNRKYRHVDNALGARGVFPDIYRKVGILKDRMWDGNDVVGEPTREVMMDLIGHLFLAIHMMDDDIAGSAFTRPPDLEHGPAVTINWRDEIQKQEDDSQNRARAAQEKINEVLKEAEARNRYLGERVARSSARGVEDVHFPTQGDDVVRHDVANFD